jgi:hypothetical protein
MRVVALVLVALGTAAMNPEMGCGAATGIQAPGAPSRDAAVDDALDRDATPDNETGGNGQDAGTNDAVTPQECNPQAQAGSAGACPSGHQCCCPTGPAECGCVDGPGCPG